MRIFWGLMLVLMLGAAVLVYGRLKQAEPPVVPGLEAAAISMTPAESAPAVSPDPAPSEPAAESPSPAMPPAEPIKDPPPDPLLDAQALDAMLGTVTGAAAEPASEEPAALPVEAEPAAPTPAPVESKQAEASTEPPVSPDLAVELPGIPPPGPEPAAPAAPKGATFAGYEVIPATRSTKDNGTLVLDDRYPVKGKGTEEEPYKVTWDLLTSSSETLAPRQGKKKLPERITMLDGRWVEVSGYIAFPLMVQEADELLLMLNQWDGCCIGVPPTPYDAVEVALIKPATGQDRFAVQGTLKGKLGVKPHLVGEWLVGIYVMDQATLSTKAIGGVAQ